MFSSPLVMAILGVGAFAVVAYLRRPAASPAEKSLADTLAELFAKIEALKVKAAAETMAQRLGAGGSEKIIAGWTADLTPPAPAPTVPKDEPPAS